MSKRILILDADARRAAQYGLLLAAADYQVYPLVGWDVVKDRGDAGRFDLIILSLPEPAQNVMAWATALRQTHGARWLLLADSASRSGVLDLLASGAADCLERPFTGHALLRRIRTVLARTPIVFVDHRTQSTTWSFDRSKRTFRQGPAAVVFTPNESRLFEALLSAAGGLATVPMLCRGLWGKADRAQQVNLTGYIRALRNKIEVAADRPTKLLHEVGYGYRLCLD
jgi:DNA-binding response OmpR family regulator